MASSPELRPLSSSAFVKKNIIQPERYREATEV
jgi:hypothetical protein